jgi:tetratricopeptide (TPR) repeat protein
LTTPIFMYLILRKLVKKEEVYLESVFGSETSKAPKWFVWEIKGVRLANDGDYDEALFCFNEAMKSWPKENPDSESKEKYFPEPTDTRLQKADLFLKMDEPELAIYYYKKFDSYIPGNRFYEIGIQKAQEMLGKKGN